MFDLTSSKLLILALVALVVVGPKDLPLLLRTIGKYVGMIRRQAAEFRTYFDDAMKEQELAQLRDEMVAMKRDVEATVTSAGRALEQDIEATKREIDSGIADTASTVKDTVDPTVTEAAAGPPVPPPSPADAGLVPEMAPEPARDLASDTVPVMAPTVAAITPGPVADALKAADRPLADRVGV